MEKNKEQKFVKQYLYLSLITMSLKLNFLDKNIDAGYEEVQVPILINEKKYDGKHNYEAFRKAIKNLL